MSKDTLHKPWREKVLPRLVAAAFSLLPSPREKHGEDIPSYPKTVETTQVRPQLPRPEDPFTQEQQEHEPTPAENITFIDISGGEGLRSKLTAEVSPIQFPAEGEERSQAIAAALLDPETAPYALAEAFIDFYGGGGMLVLREGTEGFTAHGQLVTETSTFILEDIGAAGGESTLIPLENMIKNVVQGTTEDGRPFIELEVDAEAIANALANNPSPVINMSFTVGKMRLEVTRLPEVQPQNYYQVNDTYYTIEPFDDADYPTVAYDENDNPIGEVAPPQPYIENDDGSKRYVKVYTLDELRKIPGFTLQQEYSRPRYEITEAYSEEYALENFRKLIQLCNAFPDKVFVAATGNYRSFSGEQKAQLASEWPKNLILVGQGPFEKNTDNGIEYQFTTNNIADIYLEPKFATEYFPTNEYSKPPSSSESAAIVSSLAAALLEMYPEMSAEDVSMFIKENFCTQKMIHGKLTYFLNVKKYEAFFNGETQFIIGEVTAPQVRMEHFMRAGLTGKVEKQKSTQARLSLQQRSGARDKRPVKRR